MRQRQRRCSLVGENGAYVSRSLLPAHCRRGFDFEELRLGPTPTVQAETPPAGATVTVVVVEGRIELGFLEERYVLGEGDCVQLEPHRPYSYRNIGTTETVMYVVSQHATQH